MKEKEDEDARLKSQAKRLDYITRALRVEEMPVLKKKYEAQVNGKPREDRQLSCPTARLDRVVALLARTTCACLYVKFPCLDKSRQFVL